MARIWFQPLRPTIAWVLTTAILAGGCIVEPNSRSERDGKHPSGECDEVNGCMVLNMTNDAWTFEVMKGQVAFQGVSGSNGIVYRAGNLSYVETGRIGLEWQSDGPATDQLTLRFHELGNGENRDSITGQSPLLLEIPQMNITGDFAIAVHPPYAADSGAAVGQEVTLSWSISHDGSADIEYLTCGCG